MRRIRWLNAALVGAALVVVAAAPAHTGDGVVYGYAIMDNGRWEGVVSSAGHRYPLPNNSILNGGSLAFAPDRAAVAYSVRGGALIRPLGGPGRFVATAPESAPPVFAPNGRVVYASGETIGTIGGPSLTATGLPAGARITYVAASPKNAGVFAATVEWNLSTDSKEAIYLVSARGSRRLASGFDALSELPQPRWSPDGSALAFIKAGTFRGGDLYVSDIATGRLRRLTTSQHASGPVWSPNSEEIAFTQRYGIRSQHSNGTPEVAVADIKTGGQHRLTHTPPLPPPIKNAPFNNNYITPGSVAGAWSPDGERLAIITQATKIAVIPATGGRPAIIASLPAPRVSSGIAFIAWPRTR